MFRFIDVIDELDQKHYDVAFWQCDEVIVNHRLRTTSLVYSKPPETGLPLTISKYHIILHKIQKHDFAIQFPTPDNHIKRHLSPILKALDPYLLDPPPGIANDLVMLFPCSIGVELYIGCIYLHKL